MDIAPMKALRKISTRYHFAALVMGVISIFLFGVAAKIYQVQFAVNPRVMGRMDTWGAGAFIAIAAATGFAFALSAWAALSDAESRLGSWFRRRWDNGAAAYLGVEVLGQGGFFLIFLAGSYSIYLGAAVFLCWVLFLVLLVRRALKQDTKALADKYESIF
jgi:hypothetical protein